MIGFFDYDFLYIYKKHFKNVSFISIVGINDKALPVVEYRFSGLSAFVICSRAKFIPL